MAKWIKVLIVVITIVLIVGIASIIIINSTGFKGQNINEIDITSAGSDAEIAENTKSIDECTPQEAVYITNNKIKNFNSYYACISGEVTALGGIYKQNVSGYKYKNQNGALYISKSTSAFVNVGKQIYISKDDNVQVREAINVKEDTWQNTTTKFTLNNYLQEYGVDFRTLTNYVLNDATITSATLISVENSVYTYTLFLDINSATLGYRLNMAKMGDLPSLPEFTSCKMDISINQNFEPIRITCYDNYKVEKFGGLNCISTLTIDFFNINEPVEMPEEEFFNQE